VPYLATTLALIAFGFVGMLSIGRPFLLVGLAMLVLAPLRGRPILFWPPLAAVVAWNIAFMAIAPSMCTTSQTIGAGNPRTGLGESTTVCSNLIGITYRGTGTYNPSLEPANQVALVLAVATFLLVLVVLIAPRRAGRIGGTS
jgi:hypothetical protein